MAVKANDLAIRALKPRSSPYEISIVGHRGLVVRVWPSGTRTFMLRYRQDGVLKRVALNAATLAAARAAHDARRDDLKKGDDPAQEVRRQRAERQLKRQENRAAPDVEQLTLDYIKLYAKRNKKSWRADELMLQSAVLPEWGKVKAGEIKRRDVIDLLDRIATKTPVRANRVLAVVRKMFNWAVERDIVEISPCAGVKPPSTETSRDRTLTDSEIHMFWTKLPDSGIPLPIQTALRLQLLTAVRIGEIVGARWPEFHLKKREWLIPGTRSKNGRESLVPLSPIAMEIIERLSVKGAFLFPSSGKTGHTRIDVATHELGHGVPRMGMERFTSHDLRRTAATKLAELGTSRVVIDAILNHKDRSVGAIYDRHDYMPEKRAALETWARHLESIIRPERIHNVVAMRKKSGNRR